MSQQKHPLVSLLALALLSWPSLPELHAQDPFTQLHHIFGADRGMSKGVGWADYDNDGYVDLYVTNGASGSKQKNFLYRNNGDGTFTKITTGAIVNDEFISGSCSWGDFDNDSDVDLYVTTNTDNPFDTAKENCLYVNNGDGTFTKNTTAGPPVTDEEYSVGCGWGDYNNDSFLDLFVTNGFYGKERNSLYSNDGDGTFTDITGIPLVGDEGAGFIADFAWADYDQDGDLDLFRPSGSGANNFLWRNDGGNTFTKLAIFDGGDSQACSWGDYDNDGDLDLYITNYGESEPAPEQNYLYRNDGGDVFTRVTTAGPIVDDAAFSTGSCWGDIDNDADLDMFVGNCGPPDSGWTNFLYINNGDGTFGKNSTSVVTDCTWVYGAAFADYNNDGFLDLFTARSDTNYLYKNNGPTNGNTNHWIIITCVGTTSNRAGIGAVVRAKATINGSVVWQTRDISAQTGYASHNDLRAHFGLGDATLISEIKVEWPSGIVQTLTNISIDQFLTITEAATTENLSVTSPNGEENWQVGSSHDITWTSSGTSGNVKIEYSSDNGTSWTEVVASTTDDGNFPWTVPDTPSTTCLVRITDVDGSPSDQSDAVFTISAAGLLGDVNQDTFANSTDALIILSCDVGIDVSQFCPMDCGDTNSDGLVNSTDALIILSYDVGIEVPYPVGQPGCPAGVTPCPGCNP